MYLASYFIPYLHLKTTLRGGDCWHPHYTDEKGEVQRPHGQGRESMVDPKLSTSGALTPHPRLSAPLPPPCLPLSSSLPPITPSLTHTVTLPLACTDAAPSLFTVPGSPSSQCKCRRRRGEMPQSPDAPPNPAHLRFYPVSSHSKQSNRHKELNSVPRK